MTSLLADRGAVVVGGSRGIGAAVAALLAQHGAGVVVNGRDADAARLDRGGDRCRRWTRGRSPRFADKS